MPTRSSRSLHFLQRFRPKLLDLYIFTEIFNGFLGTSIFILFTLLMFQALRLIDFLIVHQAPPLLLLKMAGFMSITFLPLVLPLSFLISILLAFSRFSSDSELVAMKACGISTHRMAFSLVPPALLLGLITLKLNLAWVPWGEHSFKVAEARLGDSQVVSTIREGTFTDGFFNLLVFADQVDSANNRLRKVFIFDEREKNSPLVYVAKEAALVPLKTDNELTNALVFELFDGSMHHSNADDRLYEKMNYRNYRLYLSVNEDNEDATIERIQALPQNELLKKIQESDGSTLRGREFRGEYWRRYSLAITPTLFIFLAIGVASFRNRSAKAGTVVVALVIVSIYWISQLLAISAMHKGQVPPFLAMQIPNLIVLALGIIAFRKAAW